MLSFLSFIFNWTAIVSWQVKCLFYWFVFYLHWSWWRLLLYSIFVCVNCLFNACVLIFIIITAHWVRIFWCLLLIFGFLLKSRWDCWLLWAIIKSFLAWLIITAHHLLYRSISWLEACITCVLAVGIFVINAFWIIKRELIHFHIYHICGLYLHINILWTSISKAFIWILHNSLHHMLWVMTHLNQWWSKDSILGCWTTAWTISVCLCVSICTTISSIWVFIAIEFWWFLVALSWGMSDINYKIFHFSAAISLSLLTAEPTSLSSIF